jgi:hypothetical protein
MRHGNIVDDALSVLLTSHAMPQEPNPNRPGFMWGVAEQPGPVSKEEFEAAAAEQRQQCSSVCQDRRLAPAKTEMTLDHDFRVTNAQQARHLEDNTLALECDVVTPVRLVYEAGLSYFETDDGVRMDINDPSGTLGSPKELDPAMKAWMWAFEEACDDSRRRLPFPARAEVQIEWRGELRLTPGGQVLWKPERHPDYSSVEGLCDALIAVWVVMGA